MPRNFELQPIKPKNCKLKPSLPLPITTLPTKYKGEFNEFSVIVTDEDSVKELISMGYFGKATLSRSYPRRRVKPEIIKERVFKNRKQLTQSKPQKIVVLEDSSEDEDKTPKPRYEIDHSDVKEFCHLGLEEAFFLAYALNCLEIQYDDQIMDNETLWSLFNVKDKLFSVNYAVYYHFRVKNWVVKSGLKFGGDYVLYKQGPAFYHASYVVIIDVIDKNYQRVPGFSRRLMDTISLLGLNRLCETAGKELLLCQIQLPDIIDYTNLSNIKIKEVIIRRWLSNQERQSEQK